MKDMTDPNHGTAWIVIRLQPRSGSSYDLASGDVDGLAAAVHSVVAALVEGGQR